jgi:glycosyltransferase involved in cell wall biosynthesis
MREGRDVVLINGDTEIFPDTISALAKAAQGSSLVGFASARSNVGLFAQTPLKPEMLPKECNERWAAVSQLLPESHIVPVCGDVCLYIKNTVLKNFFPLNSSLSKDLAIIDFMMRANKAGIRGVLANRSFAYCHGAHTHTFAERDFVTRNGERGRELSLLHTEFFSLMRRFFLSAVWRADKEISSFSFREKKKVAVDLAGLPTSHNGTSELACKIVQGLAKVSSIQLFVVCELEAFSFHGFQRLENVMRAPPNVSGEFDIALKLGQPFELSQITHVESLAPVVVYGMLDTIALDCGHMAVGRMVERYWQHVSSTANGVFCISEFSEESFVSRFSAAATLPRYTRLLPTKLSSYQNNAPNICPKTNCVLIMGNQYPHKNSGDMAQFLAPKFPHIQFAVLGNNTSGASANNVFFYRSGSLNETMMAELFVSTRAVVIPSFVEGFGFGILKTLALNKPLVARNIPATQEILRSFRSVDGVHLFEDYHDCANKLSYVMENVQASVVDDTGAADWDEWCAGLANFALSRLSSSDVFERVVRRVESRESLRVAEILSDSMLVSTAPAGFLNALAISAVMNIAHVLRSLALILEKLARSVLNRGVFRTARMMFERWLPSLKA